MAGRHRFRCLLAAAATLTIGGGASACTQRPTAAPDTWEVWVCKVHPDAADPIYGGLPLRLELSPSDLAAAMAGVSEYYLRLSHGRYQPTFRPGGTVMLGVGDGPGECMDRALDASAPRADGVLAVADAEHAPDAPGGFGRAGQPCAGDPCPASVTRRAAYVGAADFHPRWGDRPPLDLVEHEIGHALGWPHSGLGPTGSYDSALDVMSDSAAPRTVDPDHRDAPGTLAVNLLAAGWLPPTDVATVPAAGATVALRPASRPVGTRLATIRLSPTAFLTVEARAADGLDAHLPASGVSVHLVDDSGGQRASTPLVGAPPYTALLGVGDTLCAHGWHVEVQQRHGDTWTVRLTPAP